MNDMHAKYTNIRLKRSTYEELMKLKRIVEISEGRTITYDEIIKAMMVPIQDSVRGLQLDVEYPPIRKRAPEKGS
jgi:hypothetical protein